MGGDAERGSAPSPIAAAEEFLRGGGEMGAIMRAHDWAATPLGPPSAWPQPLRTAVRLILNTGHPMYVWWGADLLCLYNDAYSRSIGPERHPRSLGQPGREVWAEIWPIIGPQVDGVMRGEGATWQENALVPITRHGRREDVWWTYSYSPIDDPAASNGVGGVLVVCAETTRQVLAERSSRENEERLRGVLDGMGEGFLVLDPALRILTINAEGLRIDGRAREAIVGRRLLEVWPEAEQAPSWPAYRRAMAERVPVEVTYRHLSDRHDVWLEVRAYPVEAGLAVFYRDATDRMRAVEEAREATERLRLAQRIARVGSFDLRLGDAAAVVTPEYAAISGLPEGTTADTPGAALARLHPEDRAAHGETIRAALAGDAPGYDTEFRIVRPSDGAGRVLACRATIHRDASGRATRLIGVVRDVTEERAAADELKRLNAALETRVGEEVAAREAAQARLAHAERMQALGQLAGGIAHDFNNVLQAVQGGAALIERRPGDPEGVRRLARMVLEATGRGVTVTRRLLAFARRDELRAEPVEPGPLLAGLSEVLAYTLGAEVACRHEVAPGTPPLLADKGQLETVLVNLASNARDAMPGGGTLTFAAAEAAPGARPSGLGPGRYVRVSVADTGTGMDPGTLARLGEPFFTTKPQGKGTGLGLSMAKGFAEQSSGALDVESEPGCGTTVSLWLPVAPEGAAGPRPARPAAAADGPARRPRRVLLVDDEPIVREVVAGELDAAGYAVLVATSGREALALLDAAEEADVLVTDLSMPAMGGVELIEAVGMRRPGMPAILLTGYAGDGASIAVGRALPGPYSLLRKPVGGTQLIECIETLLAAAALPR